MPFETFEEWWAFHDIKAERVKNRPAPDPDAE